MVNVNNGIFFSITNQNLSFLALCIELETLIETSQVEKSKCYMLSHMRRRENAGPIESGTTIVTDRGRGRWKEERREKLCNMM